MADSEKRGRGRPKKTEAPAASKEEAAKDAESNDGPPPAKRGRGRPKGTTKAKSAKKAAPKKPAGKTSGRGRGRPPKKAQEEEANSSEEAAESS